MTTPYFVAPVVCALEVLRPEGLRRFLPADTREALCLLFWWVREKELEEQEAEKDEYWNKKKM